LTTFTTLKSNAVTMYKIYNKLKIDPRARGAELLKQLNDLDVGISLDGTDERGRETIDEMVLKEKLQIASSFSYIAPIKLDYFDITSKDRTDLEKAKSLDRFYSVVESLQLGFGKLKAGSSIEVRHSEALINDLITKPFAKYLKIEDTEKGEIIFDGATEMRDVEFYQTSKAKDEDKPTKRKEETIFNQLHPEKKLEISYPEPEPEVVEDPKTELETLKDEYLAKFGKAPHHFFGVTKLKELLAE